MWAFFDFAASKIALMVGRHLKVAETLAAGTVEVMSEAGLGEPIKLPLMHSLEL